MKQHVVLLSGGLDSTSLLALQLHKHSGDVSAFTIIYPSKHNKREIEAAQAVCAYYDIEHELFVAPDVFGVKSQLLRAGPPVDDGEYPIDSVASTNIPLRNPVFITCVAAIMAGRASFSELAVAVHSNDYEAWSYPDCSPEVMGALSAALYYGSNFTFRLVTPFIYIAKSDVVRAGYELGAPLHLTYSCYKGGEIHCGACPTCLERKRAFKLAEVSDPTVYEGDLDG